MPIEYPTPDFIIEIPLLDNDVHPFSYIIDFQDEHKIPIEELFGRLETNPQTVSLK